LYDHISEKGQAQGAAPTPHCQRINPKPRDKQGRKIAAQVIIILLIGDVGAAPSACPSSMEY